MALGQMLPLRVHQLQTTMEMSQATIVDTESTCPSDWNQIARGLMKFDRVVTFNGAAFIKNYLSLHRMIE